MLFYDNQFFSFIFIFGIVNVVKRGWWCWPITESHGKEVVHVPEVKDGESGLFM